MSEYVSFRSFTTVDEAWNYLYSYQYDFMDNFRFAYKDNPEQMQGYLEAKCNGCCGYHDEEIFINGRHAIIGCNYGH